MKDIEEKDNNKKRAMILSIIAIATMLIVVAGATFAYLISNVAQNGNLNMEVKTTGGSELLLISSDGAIELELNADNLSVDSIGSAVEDSANATVLLQTSGTDPVSHTLKASVVVEDNTFRYTTGACYTADPDNVVSDYNTYEGCTQNGNLWTYSKNDTNGTCYSELNKNTSSAGYEFEDLCLENSENVWATERVPELLFDLYEVNANQSECTDAGHIYNPDDQTCRLTDSSLDLTTEKGTKLVKDGLIISTTASDNKTEKVYKAVLKFENLDHNQYTNASGTFKGKLVLERVDSLED